MSETEFKIILPPKQIAIQLIESAWENACVLFRFYHRPSFIRDLDLLYETDPEDYTDKQYKILPLMYSVMAAGALFTNLVNDDGYKYFAAARKLIDITDARDLYSIQSIVMMILFLQCSAKLSTCYSYIGLALRAALRAGLHRRVNHNFNPIVMETRKRLFWTIRKMDIYVNAMLGLPRGIGEDEFDQDLPEEIDDENITEDGYYPQQKGKLSSMGISNAHTRLMTVLSHIMNKIYPMNQDDESLQTFAEICEQELQLWYDSLPQELKPGADVNIEYLKANRLLSVAYCYVRIMLYRPFIHTSNTVYSQKCIDTSRQAIYLANDLVSKSMLNGAYWFSMYTLFFSVACLLYKMQEYSLTLPDYSQELRIDAELGQSVLNKLRETSPAASRTYTMLNSLFDELNKRIGKPNDGVSVAELSMKSEQGQLDTELLGNATDTTTSSAASSNTTTNYATGPMDQIDQLFGRFVPPYMANFDLSTNTNNDTNSLLNWVVQEEWEPLSGVNYFPDSNGNGINPL